MKMFMLSSWADGHLWRCSDAGLQWLIPNMRGPSRVINRAQQGTGRKLAGVTPAVAGWAAGATAGPSWPPASVGLLHPWPPIYTIINYWGAKACEGTPVRPPLPAGINQPCQNTTVFVPRFPKIHSLAELSMPPAINLRCLPGGGSP
jgi:hypothetical protein